MTILLLQIALLLVAARLLGEAVRRLGQPAVLGELCAGIVLGPSVLGALAPAAFGAVFPSEAGQWAMLQALGWIGAVFLLLVTGLEVDLQVVRMLGRTAALTAAAALVLPLAMGFGAGMMLPERAIPSGVERLAVATFVAAALSISALPVIARVLKDLALLKRDVGLVVLSAAVIEDAIGWVLLGLAAGLADIGHIDLRGLGRSLLALAVFVAASVALMPLLRRGWRFVDSWLRLPHAECSLAIVFALLLAALSERLGLHAVLGAFVAGVILRQVPRLDPRALRELDVVVASFFAPLFFGVAGLRVDVRTLGDPWILLALLATASVSKLAGGLLGGLLGGLKRIEALAVGIGLNARGSMGLVAALVGLSIGVLTPELYSVLVLVAVITTVSVAPALRAIAPRLPLSAAEKLREEEAESAGRKLRAGRIRVLVPMRGGRNAQAALDVALALSEPEGSSITALHVAMPGERVTEDPLREVEARAKTFGVAVELVRKTGDDAAAAVAEEVRVKRHDLLMLGASGGKHLLEGAGFERLILASACPVAIVRAAAEPGRTFRRLLVPTDGSSLGRLALELAVAYADATRATVTLLHVVPPAGDDARAAGGDGEPSSQATIATIEADLREVYGKAVAGTAVELAVRVVEGRADAVIAEAGVSHDLLVLGGDARTIQRGLTLGQGTEAIVRTVGCTAVVVLPAGV